MFILVGPDGSGKSVLATKLEQTLKRRKIHYTRSSGYEDYMDELSAPDCSWTVSDRFVYCEVPYHTVLNREFAFNRKQWHNMILWSLSYNPVIILCTHKPIENEYSDDYLPFNLWNDIMSGYTNWFNEHHIDYIPYDYVQYLKDNINPVKTFGTIETIHNYDINWANQFRQNGYCFTGSPNPKVLIIAERIGPDNVHNIPFETGPTGREMTEWFDYAQLSLGDIAITNMVKSRRGDMRKPNEQDMALLEIELDNLKPKAVFLMGAVAKSAEKLLKARKIPFEQKAHWGYYNHAGITDLRPYYEQYTNIINGLLGKEVMQKEIL